MCGISGIINLENCVNVADYYRAHTSMSHRGPDDEGFISANSGVYQAFRGNNTDSRLETKLQHILNQENLKFVLGHHRLSILDLSENGHQPFVIGKYAMVYNGEIYNYLELRDELKQFGHKFFTECDTEVLLKAYIQWGTDCFNRFNGMWAVAIYNHEDQSVLLSRDRFGVKPLYIEQSNGSLLFASELSFFKTLRKHNINRSSALMYLAGNRQDCNNETFYEEIEQLSPAHYYIFKNAKLVSKKRYWNFPSEKEKLNSVDALEKFSQIFKSSIELRLRSNVPIGCLLSGGLDSTLIASLVATDLKGQEVNTYSAVYENQQFSEEGYIRETLKMHPSLKSNFIKISSENFISDMDSFFKIQSGPVRSLAVYAQFKLYEYISSEKKVTVLLNGQGSDECWAGYHNHYVHFFISRLLHGQIDSLIREVELYSKNRNVSVQSIFKSILRTVVVQILPQSVKSKLKPSEISDSFYKGKDKNLTLDAKLKENISYSALKEYLKYEDQNSMAFGKESRLPFLDYRLVDFAFSLDDHYKIDNFENKKLVRDFAQKLIPEKIVNRKDKMGFVTPQEVWQRTTLKKLMLAEISREDNLFPAQANIYRKKALDYFEFKNNDWALAWRYFNYQVWSAREN